MDPSTIPRVDAAYTVPANDNDDPHGPPGTNVPRETQAAYGRRIAKDKKDGKTIWAGGLRGMKDDARESFLATEQFNARADLQKLRRTMAIRQKSRFRRSYGSSIPRTRSETRQSKTSTMTGAEAYEQ